MSNEILFCSLFADMSDDEIKACIYSMYPRAVKNEKGFLLTLEGYNEDPREVWQIPEAIEFFKRIIDIGFLSVLAPFAQELLPDTTAFGALEVFLVSKGELESKAKEGGATNEDVEELLKVILESNAKCEIILSEPCPKTNLEQHEYLLKSPNIAEGQHRHAGIKYE